MGEGDGVERRYSITIVERFDPEARLTAAAVEMAPDDERLCSLLVTLGGIVFNEWPFSPDALLMANAVGQRVEMGIPWPSIGPGRQKSNEDKAGRMEGRLKDEAGSSKSCQSYSQTSSAHW